MPDEIFRIKTEADLSGFRALEGQTRAAQSQLAALGQEFMGVAGGVGILVAAVSQLRDVFKELQEIEGTFTGLEAQIVSLADKIGHARREFNAFTEDRRKFQEEQSDADLAQQIKTGDIDEQTGRDLQTLGAEKAIALAEARGVADPVERAKRQAAVQKDFSARETAIRNAGDERKRTLLNEETQRTQQTFFEAEKRRRNAEAVPALEAKATADNLAVEQTKERLKGLRTAETALAGMGPQVNRNLIRDAMEKNPEFKRMMGDRGITHENVMRGDMGGRLAEAVRDVQGGGAAEIAALDSSLKTLQPAALASRAALNAATGGQVTNAAQAEAFRRSETSAAAGMEQGAKQRFARASSQFQSLGEGIEHRLNLQNLGAAEAAALGKAGQAIAQAIEKATSEYEKAMKDAMKQWSKFGVTSVEAVRQSGNEITRLQGELAAVQEQLAHRK